MTKSHLHSLCFTMVLATGCVAELEDSAEEDPEVDGSISATLPRVVKHTASFETGFLRANGAVDSAGRPLPDSGFKKTMPNPQNDLEVTSTGAQGFGPDTTQDMRVVATAKAPSNPVRGTGETFSPRSGSFFLTQTLYKNKIYNGLNGDPNAEDPLKDKPRAAFEFGDDVYRFESGKEFWAGFSVYLPTNFEVENGASYLDGRKATLFLANTDSSSSFFSISTATCNKNDNEMSYVLEYGLSATSSTEGAGAQELNFKLGNIERGKWTDFVIRAKQNPFTTATNPARKGIRFAVDKLFPANDGILQVWKRSPSTGRMTLVFNLVGQPVGLVPNTMEGGTHVGLRIYKYNWKKDHTNSTVRGPIMVGWDELRYGLAEKGTGYPDVHPVREARRTESALLNTRCD